MTAALAAADVREYAWRVTQAARERLVIPILDEDGAPHPVDGWTVDARVRDFPGGIVLYTWPPEAITITGNEVELVIPAPVSAAWTWRAAWYRVKISDPASPLADPVASRVLQGPIFLDLD